MEHKEYVLEVGSKGKARLEILNQIFKDTSESLLVKAGLGKGKKILEIGCGTGNMTCWLADQVGKDGHIYAVDISAEQLEIAKKCAQVRGLTNITFIENAIIDVNSDIKFDLIYSRLVLMHISKSYETLQHLYCMLEEGGSLICEEACNSISCYPLCSAYLRSRDLLIQYAKLKNLDFNIGEKLYSYFNLLNLNTIFMNYIQPIYKNKQEKSMIPLFIHEARNNYIKYGLSTTEEIDHICSEVKKYIDNEHNLISFPRIMQIIGTKSCQ